MGESMARSFRTVPLLKDKCVPPKLFEIFVFTCALRALKELGATFEVRDNTDKKTGKLVFRLGPGTLSAPASAPGFVLVKYQKDEYELQTNLRVSGRSSVLHELDVCLLSRKETQRCRSSGTDPKSNSAKLLLECKYYGDSIPLNLGREYLGLSSEFSGRVKTFVYNLDNNPSIQSLISTHRGTSSFLISPLEPQRVTAFIGWLKVELAQVL